MHASHAMHALQGGGSDVAEAPDQRDVEGLGGQFWYEARMGGGP